MDLHTKISLVTSLLQTKEIPVSTGAKLLGVNRTSIYYKKPPMKEEEKTCKELLDKIHTDNPAWGSRQLRAQLNAHGHKIGLQKTRRYMSDMDITVIYQKMNLSKRMQQAKVCPYLLRNMKIVRPNQVWSIDITYIGHGRTHWYLTAVIDWYSRFIVGWEMDDTLDTRMVIKALKKALKLATPDIINSDQGCQFTSQEYIDFLREKGIRQSMDGKSRWADNVIVERWFRTYKYEEVFLNDYKNLKEARIAVAAYIHTYNYLRYHSSLDNKAPAQVYFNSELPPDSDGFYCK